MKKDILKVCKKWIWEVIGFIKGVILVVLAAFSIIGVTAIYNDPITGKKVVQKLFFNKKGDDIK